MDTTCCLRQFRMGVSEHVQGADPLSDVCWFINPMNTIDICTINHNY